MQAEAMERAQQRTASVASATPAPKPAGAPNRRQRRYNALFNRKLNERMKKDQLPASFEVLPDGGIHVKVDGRSVGKSTDLGAAALLEESTKLLEGEQALAERLKEKAQEG